MKKIAEWWKSLDPSMKGLIIIGLICLIGIILRWDYVVGGIRKGFNYYGGGAD
ncbi:MAG: hypothetical protein J6W86_05875 [Bacteroidales bacterium]|nr:hypothetical protein [Bacteroidales bacterium]